MTIPAVAHYARFEEEFLRPLHERTMPDRPFPLGMICTHEIARRLLPDLPRRGLRALAGYFGHRLPELKRAASHVEATGLVWVQLVEHLRNDHGVATLDDLAEFLAAPPPARGTRWTYPLPRERRLNLPDGPGVYRFLDGSGSVLYVGKAASLHTRVNSYFRKRRAEEKLLELVSQVKDLAVTQCPSALEAALLEAAEIQRLDPPYNRVLRDTGQGVWFFTPDLDHARRRPGRGYPLGPVPSRDPFASVRLLSRLSGRSSEKRRLTRVQARNLGIDSRHCEAGALEDGLQEFFGRQAGGLQAGVCTTKILMAAGARLWREQQALLESQGPESMDEPKVGRHLNEDSSEAKGFRGEGPARDEESDLAARLVKEADQEEEGRLPAKEDSDGVQEQIGPEMLDEDGLLAAADVADILEATLIAAVRQRRRTRWFVRLSESTVAWDASDGGPGGRRLVSVEQGTPRGAETLGPDDPLPAPSGWGIPPSERRRRIDRAAYDRLRVLNSEMRRVLRSGRSVEVRLGPDLLIEPDLLGRILERV